MGSDDKRPDGSGDGYFEVDGREDSTVVGTVVSRLGRPVGI